MKESTITERLMAASAHLVSFIALVPYFVGITLVPAGPIWTGGLTVTAAVALIAWKRAPFAARHSTQAALLLLAAYLPELLAFLFFVLAVSTGIRINMTDGTLQDGVLAGYNPETLIRVALAPVFLAIPCYRAYQAFHGKACRMPPWRAG